MAPQSLSSLDAAMSLFPSRTPQIPFHCNCFQPFIREAGWGRFSREVSQSQPGDMDLLQGGKAQTGWVQNYIFFPGTSEATHINYAYDKTTFSEGSMANYVLY